MKVGKQLGFTLIELMIAVAVIAILASIAYPSYMRYVQQTNRVEVQAHLMELSHRLENYKLANQSYANATLAQFGGNYFPATGPTNYQISLTDGSGIALTSDQANPQTWVLVARPSLNSRQKNTGAISMSSSQIRCWYKDTDDANVFTKNDAEGKPVAPDQCTETW